MIKKLATALFLAVGSIFLGATARAEVVTINWTGSIDYVADIWSTDPRSLAALGISANWPPGTGGTAFTISFSYDSTTQPFSSTTDGVNSQAYFQGISASFSAEGKLLLQNAAPIILITEDSDVWSFMPLVQKYPNPPLYLNDNLNNQTNWKLSDGIRFGVSNSDHATNAYNGIGLLYNQLPTASQFQQIANEVDRTYTMWDPVQNADASFQVVGQFSPEYFGSPYFSSSTGDSLSVTSVPEPSALSLLAVGLGGLAMIRRRRS